MGQYHLTVNLTKREFLHPHKLGNGLKLWEQISGGPGSVTAALFALLAVSNGRGGGDLDENSEIVGRWGGDRIAVVGDYAEDSDIPDSPIPASEIYRLCVSDEERNAPDYEPDEYGREFTDISDRVAAYLETLFDGKYIGKHCRQFVTKGATVERWKKWDDPESRQQRGTITKLTAKYIDVTWADPDKVQKYAVDADPDFFTCSQ